MVAANMVSNTRKPGMRPYDLVLLDLDMPILNGYDACH